MSSEIVWLAETQASRDERFDQADRIRACKAAVLYQREGKIAPANAIGEAAFALRHQKPVLYVPEDGEHDDASWWLLASCHFCRFLRRDLAGVLVGAIADHMADERFHVAFPMAISTLLEKHESPIELRLGLHLVNKFDLAADLHFQHPLQIDGKSYRVDFMISNEESGAPIKGVVVEADGHDYHERTKEQAARDRSRDRAMTAAGYTVLRYTGSEIWKDAAKCAEQAYSVAVEKFGVGT